MKRRASSPQKTGIWLDGQSVFYIKSGPFFKKSLSAVICFLTNEEIFWLNGWHYHIHAAAALVYKLAKKKTASCFFVTQQTLLSPRKLDWLIQNYPSVSRCACDNWNLDNAAVLQVYMKFQE